MNLDGAPQTGYRSVLDLGGAAVPSKDLPAEAPAGVEEVDKEAAAAPGDRVNLPEEIIIAMLDARGPITVDAIQEHVNGKPGSYVPRGPIEAQLIAWEGEGKARHKGSDWELTAAYRADQEGWSKVVERRSEILATLAVMTFPVDADLVMIDAPIGATVAELMAFMTGGEARGAMTADGLTPRYISEDVLIRDLEQLVASGALVQRTAAEEELVQLREPGAELDETIEGAARFAFAPKMLAKMLSEGGLTMATASVPAAPPRVMEAAAASAMAAERSAFEREASERLDAEKAARVTAQAELQKIRDALKAKSLGWIADEALSPPPAPVEKGPKCFELTQTVPMTDAERAILLNELAGVEDEMAEIEARVTGAVMAANSAKTSAKERLSELKDRKRDLLQLRDAKERTYAVEAYTEFLAGGDEESAGAPVNITRAKSDGRVLKREVLTPRQVFDRAVEGPPEKAKPTEPQDAPKAEAPPVLAGYTGILESFLLSAKGPQTVAQIHAKTRIPILDIEATIAGMTGVTAAPDGWSLKPRVDQAAKDAEKAEEKKAAEAAAKPRLVLSTDGIRPFVLAAIIAAGENGLGEGADTDAAVSALSGAPNTESLSKLVRVVTLKLIGAKTVERRDGRVFFATKQTLLGIVTEAGDEGTTEAKLLADFFRKTGTATTDAVRDAVNAAITAAVDGEDLNRGPSHVTSDVHIWLSGQVDPRRTESSASASTEDAAPKRGRAAKKTAAK